MGHEVIALERLGWGPFFEEAFARHRDDDDGVVPARVVSEHKGALGLRHPELGDLAGEIPGRLRHEARSRAELPAVGDWVVASPLPAERKALVRALLPRRSAFVRRNPGEPVLEQVLAANLDSVFLVSGLDHDFNLRRIERYLVMAWDSGARPVILLNKTDLAEDLPAVLGEVESVALGVPIHALSAKAGEGLAALDAHLGPGQTVALLGSSGAGKSTLLNRLLGAEVQRTQEVRRSDSRGRHATSHRQLFELPGGALVIDTPGLRELQLWDPGSGIEGVFEDVEALAQGCAFADCEHLEEPRCGVKQAVAEGRLAGERLQGFHKLRAELAALQARHDPRARADQRRLWRQVHRAQRRHTPRG